MREWEEEAGVVLETTKGEHDPHNFPAGGSERQDNKQHLHQLYLVGRETGLLCHECRLHLSVRVFDCCSVYC